MTSTSYLELGRVKETRTARQQALERLAGEPSFTPPAALLPEQPAQRIRLASQHALVGNIYRRQGRYEDAVREFNLALSLDPGQVSAYNDLGLSLEALGRADEGKRAFETALRLDPEFAAVHGNLGNHHFRQGTPRACGHPSPVASPVPAAYDSLVRWRLGELIVLSICAAGIAEAQIYEWRDAGGGRHFTNVLVNVPAEQQATVREVVAKVAPAANEEAAAADEPAEAARHEAEVVYDFSQHRDRYAEGLRDGLALAASVPERPGGGVRITGPLAVASTSVFQPPLLYSFPEPLVTTSFDRGRSRHLTLRMLLQDQFQLDRDGPFVFEALAPVRRGPNLAKRLPRGVPHYRSGRVALPAARMVTR